MKYIFLIIKPYLLPLASSISLHAVVISSFFVFSSAHSPGHSGGGVQQVYEVSFVGSKDSTLSTGIAEGNAIPALIHPETSRARLKFLTKAPTIQEIEDIKDIREESLDPKKQSLSTLHKVDAPNIAKSPGPFGSGGGTKWGSGSGDASLGSNGGQGRMIRPALLSAPKPPYPEHARLAGFEGRVVLEALIDADGNVTDTLVQHGSGRKDCDASARRTILERWRFHPARVDGEPVPYQEKIIVVFSLSG